VKDFFEYLWEEPVYTVLIAFLCAYPLSSGLIAVVAALRFRSRPDGRHWRKRSPDDVERAQARYPVISVVIPAHNEAEVIGEAIEGVLRMRWPELDVIVVDDCSQDATAERVRSFVETGRVRLLSKPVNEGKSLAINDALPMCRGELVLLMDADGIPDPTVLEEMVPHFLDAPAVAAVTGNPRVLNTSTFFARLQAVEFSSSIGVQRRGDAVWGRLMTFSGLCALFDRDAVAGIGGFAADMATEDIELTWRLQLEGREVIYEPAALFGMQAPETLRLLWRQRIRWVRGLAQVLRRHTLRVLRPTHWRMWPVLVMSWLSIIWAHLLVLFTALWLVSGPWGRPPPEILPFLALFGSITIVAGIIQAFTGMWFDRVYDPAIRRQWPWVAWYPAVYWVLCVLLVVRATLPGLLREPKLSVWQIPRESLDPARATRS
jgi:biofilm PGA synthesis N-glycosyltransferase PgaC